MAETAPTDSSYFLGLNFPGGDSFTLNIFQGVERISDLFEYTLFMTTTDNDANFDSLMGKSATVSITINSETRYFNGIIGKFEQEAALLTVNEPTVYRATLYPNLWLLKFSGQCRIFQNQSIVSIITSILDQSQITYSNQVSNAGTQPVPFCVQYNETDFNFISRLMETNGIFYFFQQTENGNTLILADAIGAYSPCPSVSTVNFENDYTERPFLLMVESCSLTQRIVPQSNTIVSFNYLAPQNPLQASATGPTDAGGGTITTYDEIYAQQSEGAPLAATKLQSEEFPQKMVEGLSTVPFFLPGFTFELENHPRTDANTIYTLYEIIHEASLIAPGPARPLYENKYKAFTSTTLFQPAQKTPKPRIYSTQTAIVTGPSGQEICTDQYGRIKVKFHWDPSPATDDTTSCWIRVATLWAGQSWGTLFTPRVGQEVVVSFIDGDPDNPLVVGTVYNGVNLPPYLPQTPTKSTIKSNTSINSNSSVPAYNEFGFDDLAGSEQVFLRAQKDYNVYVQNDQNITIVGGNRTILLQSQDEQNETRTGQQSNDSLTLANGDKSLTITQGNYTILLNQGNISVTCASGNVSFDVTGDISFKCSGNFSVNATQAISFTAGTSISSTATTDITEKAGGAFSLTASADATFDAGGNATLKGGGAVEITGGGDTSVKAGGALELSGGGTASLKGATVAVSGGEISLN